MKKVKVILSMAAVAIAAGGALATSMYKNHALVANVASNQLTCALKGTCSQTPTSTICKTAQNITLFSITSASTCGPVSHGTFTAD
jgi:hypothetical protein